ncbi:type I polyketide synthase [Mycolicibacterium mengxianglii]|uniref:type I polyketide synthase n=1 Tax=Mycolicibacterium mengxianglii TaxID=2736649 RepID=UPI0018D09020|nr:type I polyketide synthase [Mycolicibacterium mengxianglii]
MTEPMDETGMRNWLVDYLVTTIGCSADEVDVFASMNDLGVGSRDAVVLSGELSELLGRPVSPVEFWQHPTIDSLARFLAGAEADDDVVLPELVRTAGTLNEPIAVIGMGCRLPGGISAPEELWQLLAEGRTTVSEVPEQRWAAFNDGSAETTAALAGTTRWGSFLTDIDVFDPEFFDISLREAQKMDPQQRLMLEVAVEALENAGIPPSALRCSHTGVFVGASVSEYGYLASTYLPSVDAWSNSGGALSIIANRLSYFLDLRGPSITVDTACSSSLVALHLACQSLRTQDCDVAIAGGVNVLLSPAVFRGFDQSGALSATGACHSFDADADGFVRGEGCGVVVLKRLSDALRDGNRPLAVVRGSAVNQDGRSNGMLAPNPAAQMAVLRAAYANAGVPPQEVDYVETHGTGTMLGDPIEARALGSVLGRGRPSQASPLLLGAVKTNLGHLEAAAGVVGFIKTVMAVNRAIIPGNLHFRNPNPHIPFDQLRLKVPAEQQRWPHAERPRRAGVSSFGFGGTNAHVVVEQAPELKTAVRSQVPAVSTLVVSGSSTERIAATAASVAEWMVGDGRQVPLAAVAHTLNHHRSVHARFATVCARRRDVAVAGLQALAEHRGADGVVGPHDGACAPGTAFVYSGQGSHWAGMGRALLEDEPAFAGAIAALEPVFVKQVGFSLWQTLACSEPVSGDAQVQPVLMGLQLGLTELWRSYGVHPDAVIGHSMGEVTAAVVAGALSIADGLKVIGVRSRLMSRLAGQGGVALLHLDADETEALIADFPSVSVAGYVSPRQTVVAGPVAPVDAAIAAVIAQNRFARRVNMEVASHTALMDPILDELRSELSELTPRKPTIPFLSTAVEAPGALDADYWADNVRQPARLMQAVTAAARDHCTFIEVSAHPILTHAIGETVEQLGHHHCIGTLSRDGDDTVRFHTNLNATHTTRPPETPHLPEPHPVLPATPWLHSRHWSDFATVRRRGEPAYPRGTWSADADLVPEDWYCQVTWPARDLPGASIGDDSVWLVIGKADLATELGRLLGDQSRSAWLSPTVLSPTTLVEDAGRAALADALAGVTHVLYAPSPVPDGLAAGAGYDVFNAARRLAAVLASMASSASGPPRLHLLTRNAQPVGDGDRANAVHAVLWGLGRTLALEHPEFWGGVIDVDETVPARLAATYVLGEARGGDDEDQVVYRAGQRRVPRLHRSVPNASAPAEITKDGCHLVIGATGNIGPHLIRQLADMGAGTVVAVSRNPGSSLDELAESLSGTGTSLLAVAADTTDAAAMAELFARFGADLPPLHGIYLAAFGGGPVTLADMTDADVAAMFRPKLDAVSVLHALSLHQPLRQFVMFSSISGLTGSRWLAHYTATSTFLDTFASARRAAGLPATTVNWGLWKSLIDNQSEQESQVSIDSGLEPMPDEVAIAALRWVIGSGAPVRSVVVSADWDLLATAYRTRAPLRIVDDLLVTNCDGGVGSTSTTAFRSALREAEPIRRGELLGDHVSEQVAAAMGLVSRKKLDRSAGFFQSGMDSLMSVTLQRGLSESLGVALPTSAIFDYPSVNALTGYLATILPELVEVADAQDVDEYDDLTDDELLAQLSERLS